MQVIQKFSTWRTFDHLELKLQVIQKFSIQVIQKFCTMEEVIGRANNNNYGLAAAVFTKDVSNALFMSNRWKDGDEYDASILVVVLVCTSVR